MVDNEQRRDELLARLTDHLLAGQVDDDLGVPEEMETEMRAVRMLRQVIDPDAPINPAFRESLTRRLNDEWNRTQRDRRVQKNKSNIIPLFQRRSGLLAAAAMIAIVTVAVLALSGAFSGDQSVGTTPEVSTEIFIGFLIVGAISGLVYYIWGRRQ